MSRFTVVYDVCVLYPAPLRDTLMHLALNPYGIDALHPDDFIYYQIDMAPSTCVAAIKRQRLMLKNPETSVDDFLATLQKQQLPQTVSRLREFGESL